MNSGDCKMIQNQWLIFFLFLVFSIFFIKNSLLFAVYLVFSMTLWILKKYIIIFMKRPNYVKLLIVLIVVLKVGLSYYDRNIKALPFSGADTEMFLMYAEEMSKYSEEYLYFKKGAYSYSSTLAVFYKIFNSPLFPLIYQVLLSGIMIDYFYKILLILEIKKKKKAMLFFSFFPAPFIFSVIPLRELPILFLLTISIYYFFKGIKYESNSSFISAIFFIILGAIFHDGTITALGGYFSFLLFKNKKLKLYHKVILILILVLLSILFFKFFAAKLNNVSLEGVLQKIKNSDGYSAKNATSHYGTDSFLLNFIYFLYTPFIWQIKSIGTTIAVIDAVTYLYLSLNLIKDTMKTKNSYLYFLSFTLLSMWVTFSIGTGNYGTAIRHRNKFFIILAIYYALMENKGEKKDGI